jgi:uncharacterized protein with HEPN domain
LRAARRSDIDLAAEFDPAAKVDLFRMIELELELGAALGRRVEILPEPVESPRLRSRVEQTVSVPSDHYRTCDCVADILDNIERIEGYISGLDRDGLGSDGLRRDAVERWLERICEAGIRLGDRAPTLMPDQPWQAIRGLGNRLRHASDRIDLAVIWVLLTERLPELTSA